MVSTAAQTTPLFDRVPPEVATLAKAEVKKLGGPMSSADIVADLQNPYSLLMLAARAEVSTVWAQEIITETLKKISRVEMWIRAELDRLKTLEENLRDAATAANDEEATEEYLDVRAQITKISKLTQEVEDFRQTLEKQKTRLNELSAERKKIAEPLLQEWDQHNKQQTDIMVDKFNEQLDPQHRLDEEDKQVLNKVARVQQVQLKYPELIPANEVDQTATPEEQTKQLAQVTKTAEAKADVNFELTLASLLVQKDKKDKFAQYLTQEDESTQNLKPSEVKKALEKLTAGGDQSLLSTTLAERRVADRKLAEMQAAEVRKLSDNERLANEVRKEVDRYLSNYKIPSAPPAPQFAQAARKKTDEEEQQQRSAPTPFRTRPGPTSAA